MNTLATWRSAMKLEKNGDLPVTVLEIVSFMAPEKIHICFILNLINYIPNISENDVIDALRLLIQLSLLTQNEPGVLEVKPIIQQVVRTTVQNRDSVVLKAVQLTHLALEASDLPQNKKLAFMKHSYVISGYALHHDAVLKKLPRVPVLTVWSHIFDYKLKHGLELADRVLAKYTTLFGNNDRDTLDVRRSIGWAFYLLGMNQEAMDVLQHVYPKALKHLGPIDPLTLIASSDLASVFQAMGKYDMAINLYNMLIPIYQSFNETATSLLTVLFNKANCLTESGDHESALVVYDETLKFQIELLGSTHEVVLKTQLRIAKTLILNDQEEKGQELLKNIYQPMQTVLGDSHVLTKEAAQILKALAKSTTGDTMKNTKSLKVPNLHKTSKTEL